jgi:hypothetical protein
MEIPFGLVLSISAKIMSIILARMAEGLKNEPDLVLFHCEDYEAMAVEHSVN